MDDWILIEDDDDDDDDDDYDDWINRWADVLATSLMHDRECFEHYCTVE